MSLVVMDIEASGFGRGSYPIEIGFVLENKETHCRLVKPCAVWQHWNDEAEAVHHISRDLLNQSGHPIESVAHWLNRHLTGRTVYTDGWSHDLSWLGKLFDAANVMQRFRLESIATRLSHEAMQHWHEEKYRVEESLKLTRHRASSDALIIQQTYRNLSGD